MYPLRADSYEEGLRRLKKLQTLPYAYSTDCDGPTQAEKFIRKMIETSKKDLFSLTKDKLTDNWLVNLEDPININEISSSSNESLNTRPAKMQKRKKRGRGQSQMKTSTRNVEVLSMSSTDKFFLPRLKFIFI